jgi:hypothetical protein
VADTKMGQQLWHELDPYVDSLRKLHVG